MSRSYIKLVGNLTNITGGTGSSSTTINTIQQPSLTCIVNIGYWNMLHGSGGFTRGKAIPLPSSIATNKVRDVQALICGDSGGFYPIIWGAGNNLNDVGGRVSIDSSRNIQLERNDAGFFNAGGFSGGGNRGFVSVSFSNIKPPSGITGTVSGLAANCFHVDNNAVTFEGNSPICEYGVVYSQLTSNPTISACKVCTVGNIGVGVQYSKSFAGLQDNTLTYFRMYAKNCEETGYGAVKSCLTPALAPLTDITFNVNRINDFGIQTNGTIDLDQSMSTGQWVCLSINYNQTANTIGSCGRVCISCKPNGGSFFSDITPSIDPSRCMCTDNTQYCGFGGGQFQICKGDCICYQNYSDGNSGSCSSFCVHPSSSSVGLTVHQGSCNEDSVVNI